MQTGRLSGSLLESREDFLGLVHQITEFVDVLGHDALKAITHTGEVALQ